MDDLGDDSVQLVVRISREAFEMWMRHRPGKGERPDRSVASDLAEVVGSGDVRGAGDAEAEECGWKQITLASTDLEGIQSRLADRNVVFQVNERLDGDIDVYFQAASEDAVREALADIIANEALSQEGQSLDAENYAELDEQACTGLDGREYEGLEPEDDNFTEEGEAASKHAAIEEQIEEAQRSESSREQARADQARERTMSQSIER